MYPSSLVRAAICTAFVNFALTSASAAQDTGDASGTPEERHTVETDASATLSVETTDNVFPTGNNKRSDLITVFGPWAEIELRSKDLQLSFAARGGPLFRR